MGDDNNRLVSYAKFSGSGSKANVEVEGFQVRAILEDNENATVGDNMSTSISFNIPDDSGIGSSASQYNTQAQSSLKILHRLTDVSSDSVTGDFEIKLRHNSVLNTTLKL